MISSPHTSFLPRRILAVTGAAMLSATALVACGSDEQSSSSPTSQSESAEQDAQPEKNNESEKDAESEKKEANAAPAEGGEEKKLPAALAEASTEDSQQDAGGEADLEIADVRSGDFDGYDRAVIEFTGSGTPGWFIGYMDEPRQHTSGHRVDMKGESFLEVNVPGMGMPTEPSEDATVTKAGVVEGAGDQGMITDIYHGGVFEAQGQFIIGLNGDERPYSVTFLEEPTRLVIDFEE